MRRAGSNNSGGMSSMLVRRLGVAVLACVVLVVLVMFAAQLAQRSPATAASSSSSTSSPASSAGAGASSSGTLAPWLSSDEMQRRMDAAVRQEVAKQMQLLKSAGGAARQYLPVPIISADTQKRVLVTGGAGFVGSHLVDKLMLQGHYVYVLDSLYTGRRKNIEHWEGHPNFRFFQGDVIEPFMIEVDEIYHLACPASPPQYQHNPIKTIKTSTMGTINMLGLAKRVKAKLLFASTSEVYGDPEQHPQKETYWGHVNTLGPRSCYDEGKRVAETMCLAYKDEGTVDVRIVRIFNTFGPRMHPNDGRVVSNFIMQALQGKPLTVYGDGSQTRSFQYVADLVDGLVKLMASNFTDPVNIGNPDEYSILDFAEKITNMVAPGTPIVHQEAKRDDPHRRRPDISRAKRVLGWQPRVTVDEGLRHTIEYFRQELDPSLQRTVVWLKD